MNKIPGKVTRIVSTGNISSVEIEIAPQYCCSSLVIDTTDSCSYLNENAEVTLLFKEIEVSLAKELSGHLSINNVFPGVISNIQWGEILTMVTVDFLQQQINALVATSQAQQMSLAIEDTVKWLVKANEITIME